jgi:hypothetical protein
MLYRLFHLFCFLLRHRSLFVLPPPTQQLSVHNAVCTTPCFGRSSYRSASHSYLYPCSTTCCSQCPSFVYVLSASQSCERVLLLLVQSSVLCHSWSCGACACWLSHYHTLSVWCCSAVDDDDDADQSITVHCSVLFESTLLANSCVWNAVVFLVVRIPRNSVASPSNTNVCTTTMKHHCHQLDTLACILV